MAEHLTTRGMCNLAGRLLVILLAATQAPVFAQALVDPTRPPAAATQAVGEGSEQAASEVGPVLQSVLISPRRTEAIVSGLTVKVGDKVGDAKVVRITESEVVLRNGKDVQVLKLFPNIEKKRAGSSRHGPVANSR